VNEAQFVRLRKPEWQRLEAFAARLDGQGERLTGKNLFDLISLYRRTAGDLARARTLKVRPDLVDYLNGLVGRVHFRLYTARAYPFRKFLDFYRAEFPRVVRRSAKPLAVTLLLLFVPAFGAYAAVKANPFLETAFAPPGYAEQAEEAFGDSFGEKERSGGTQALMHSFYIVNNIRVAILAFAAGIFLGLGTILIIMVNGMILGGAAALVEYHGVAGNFWSFVAPHGGIELGAIVIAGAAGLRIGLALLNPGPLTRRHALAAAAKEAGLLMGGVITLLALAAMIEAWISPSLLPGGIKLALGAFNLIALVAYLTLAGRGKEKSPGVSAGALR